MAAERELSASPPGAFARDIARQLGVAGFWRWWGAQLASVVPAGPRAAWQRRRMRPVLAFDAHRATVWRPIVRDGRLSMAETAAIPLDGNPDEVVAAGRHALATLPGAGRGTPVTVALPPRTVLRKTLTLPLAVEENLRQAVGYDLDRHTPFKPDELYYDAHVVGRDTARGVLRVELATARRSVVDPLIRHAESWGASVAGVSADPPDAPAAEPMNLLAPDRRPARMPFRRWQFWLPFGLLALFVIVATVLPVWQKREYAIALADLTDRARQQAAVSETLRAEIERQVADYNFALERKFTYPPAVQILDDVSRLMPDDTWLTQLELRTSRGKEVQRELTLRGESANAGRLVTVLEDSRLFTQAAPRSPTTKIQPGPGEIFDVGAQLKPLPPPPATPVVVASAAGAPPTIGGPRPNAAATGTPAAAGATPAAGGPTASQAPAPSASQAATPQSSTPQSSTPQSPTSAAAAPAASSPGAAPSIPAQGRPAAPATSSSGPAPGSAAPSTNAVPGGAAPPSTNAAPSAPQSANPAASATGAGTPSGNAAAGTPVNPPRNPPPVPAANAPRNPAPGTGARP